MAERKILIIHPDDNVAVALKDLNVGEEVEVENDGQKISLLVKNNIIFGHKIALISINKGEEVIKYGQVIGLATISIEAGEHLHIHNMENLRGRGDLE